MSDPALDLAFKIGVALGKSEALGREIERLNDEFESAAETEKDRTDNGQELQDDVRQVERAND